MGTVSNISESILGSQTTHEFTAAQLMEMNLPPMRWAIPDLLPQGVTVFAGKPKIGKSRMILAWCLAIATGGKALGTIDIPESGDVLYLALEDGKRRLQNRIKVLCADKVPDNLTIWLQCPKLADGGIEQLRLWLQSHPNAKAIFIDVLQRVRMPSKGNGHIYQEDYNALSELLPMAEAYGVAIVVVHHSNKVQDAEDPLDEISGSTGLPAGVDNLIILRRGANSSEAKLYLRGREVEENELLLRYDQDIAGYKLSGDDVSEFGLSDTRIKVMSALPYPPQTLTPTQIALQTGLSENTVKQHLNRMLESGQADKIGRGQYTRITNVTLESIADK
jgi:hypothetical protein